MKEAEVPMLREQFVKQRLKEGTCTSGQVDKGWDEMPQKIEDDYRDWLKEKRTTCRCPPSARRSA